MARELHAALARLEERVDSVAEQAAGLAERVEALPLPCERRHTDRRLSPVADVTSTWSPWLSSALGCAPAAPRWIQAALECGGPTDALERAVRDGWAPATAGRDLDHWARPGEDGLVVERAPLPDEAEQWRAYQDARRRRDEAAAAKDGRGPGSGR